MYEAIYEDNDYANIIDTFKKACQRVGIGKKKAKRLAKELKK